MKTRRVTIVNCTGEVILCRPATNHPSKTVEIIMNRPLLTLEIPQCYWAITLYAQDTKEDAKWAPTGFKIKFPLRRSAIQSLLDVSSECPWTVCRTKVAFMHDNLIILPRRDASSFLSEIPDTIPLSSVTLPGTHDTMAFYGWPISQCQSLATPLATQLVSGIRVLDVRLAVVKGKLKAYHGIYPQRASFQEILSVIHDFLTSPKSCKEALVMSIKQEDFATVPGSLFSELVHKEIMEGPGGRDMWFLDNRIPLLGEVRGKVILFSRFGGNGEGWENGLEGMGIHPTAWPDSEKVGFTWDCKNTTVRTHDWYNIPSFLSIPEKTALASRNLLPLPDDPPIPTLPISFFSAASFPFAFPPTIARGFGWPKIGLGFEGVNARFTRWVLDMLSAKCEGTQDAEPRIRGWALFDFYEDPEPAVVPLLIECNFRGRVRGEEGWS